MVSLLQEEIISLPALTVVFRLRNGSCLIQFGRNISNGVQIVFMLSIWKALNSL